MMHTVSARIVFSLVVLLTPGLPITLQAQPTELLVKRDRITAGLLATIIPTWSQIEPSTVLAYAPRPGARREVRRAELLRWGQNQGLELDGDQIPDSLLVRRATSRLRPQDAKRHLIESLAETHQVSTDQLSVELVDFRPPLIPGGELQFDVPRHSLVLNRAVPLSLRWTDTDNHTGQVILRASVTIQGTFAVAVKTFPPARSLAPTPSIFEAVLCPVHPNASSFPKMTSREPSSAALCVPANRSTAAYSSSAKPSNAAT